ncbi:MAG TPA: PIG-L family deacetylase [Gemmatimonadaceae bacterium]|nr:PIG-L family deacetylase [Gemmatimonadaceae bacterium]
MPRLKPLSLLLAWSLVFPGFVAAQTRVPGEGGAAALGELVEGMGVSVRVLMIGAHPDDEDTRLITWLTKGEHADVAYLSLTRGDGGQNLIGNELGEALGVIRTEELLAARRLDGAHQYFTRAYDFGFSKSAAESFQHWPHDSVLSDVVTVIRAFRPHVIVSVFSGTPRDGHGQHQVAGIVAREAFDAAMDTVRFPRSATAGLGPWTPLKFYRSRSYWGGEGATFTYNAGQYDPLLGESYAELAALSRSQHKSQGFGRVAELGSMTGSVRREASRVGSPGDPDRERSIFAGIDTTWGRLDSLVSRPEERAIVARLVAASKDVRAKIDLFDPTSDVDALTRTHAALSALAAAEREAPRANSDVLSSVEDGIARTTSALLMARGIAIEATVDRDFVALGDSIAVDVSVYNRGKLPVAVRVPRPGAPMALASAATGSGSAHAAAGGTGGVVIAPESSYVDTIYVHGDSLSRPWWLVAPRHGDMFTVPLDGESEDSRNLGPTVHILFDDGAVETEVPVVHVYGDPVRGEVRRPLRVVPPVSVTLDRTVALARAGAPIERSVRVTVRSAIASKSSASLSLELPRGLTADSATRTIALPGLDSSASYSFTVRGTLAPGEHRLAASVQNGGKTYGIGYVPVDYEHIRPRNMYRDAAIDIHAVDATLPPGLRVGYIQGVGDNVAPALRELGVPLTLIDPASLASADLSRFNTIVVGTRAYQSHPELAANNARLLKWVQGGGTLVVQYGQYEMARPGMMPYPITLSRPAARVTDENAPVKVLKPESPLLTWPNHIGPADWKGWVQERSVYMPTTFDSHYTALLEMHDPGEQPNDGAILVTPYGKGTYVYTTLSLFRQLPAGNPGGARLMLNLLGAGRGK